MRADDESVAPDLVWLFDVLWGGVEGVRRTPGPTSSGPGYMAIPSARHARAIVPGERLAARAALTSGGQARSDGSRRARALAARVAGSPLAGAAFRDRFWVDGDDPLRDAVASALGEAPLAFAAAVRPPGPFRKPVLQAVTPDGRVVGYAKVAWNAVTATNVRAEHAALVLLADAGPPAPRGPAPVALLDHRGFPVLVTRPMPERLRRYDASDGPPPPPVSRAVASLPFTPGLRPRSDRRTAACPIRCCARAGAPACAAGARRPARRRRRADRDVARRRVARRLVRVEPRVGRRAALGMGLGVLPGRCSDRPGPAAFHLPAALHRRADARADRLHRRAGSQRGGAVGARVRRRGPGCAPGGARRRGSRCGISRPRRPVSPPIRDSLQAPRRRFAPRRTRSANRVPSAGPVRTRGPRARPPRPPPSRSTDPRAAGRSTASGSTRRRS